MIHKYHCLYLTKNEMTSYPRLLNDESSRPVCLSNTPTIFLALCVCLCATLLDLSLLTCYFEKNVLIPLARQDLIFMKKKKHD